MGYSPQGHKESDVTEATGHARANVYKNFLSNRQEQSTCPSTGRRKINRDGSSPLVVKTSH